MSTVKLLGATFSYDLKWDEHINTVLRRCASRLYALRVLRNVVHRNVLLQTYNGIILSLLDYCSSVFVVLPSHLQVKLRHLQNRCHFIVHEFDCKCGNFENVNDRRIKLAVRLFSSAECNPLHPLHELIPRRFQRTNQFMIEFTKTSRRQRQLQIFLSIYLNGLHTPK